MVLDDHDITDLEAISQGTGSIGHEQRLHPQELEHSDWECRLARGRTDGWTLKSFMLNYIRTPWDAEASNLCVLVYVCVRKERGEERKGKEEETNGEEEKRR